jgi:hypothetical protein
MDQIWKTASCLPLLNSSPKVAKNPKDFDRWKNNHRGFIQVPSSHQALSIAPWDTQRFSGARNPLPTTPEDVTKVTK